MPRRPHKRFSKRGKGAQGVPVETESGKLQFCVAASSISASPSSNPTMVSTQVALNPTGFNQMTMVTPSGLPTNWQVIGGNKLVAFGNLFQFYRFTKFKFRILTNGLVPNELYVTGGPQQGEAVVGYQSPDESGVTSQPVSINGAYNLPWLSETVTFGADGGTLPSVPKWQNIPKKILMGSNVKWWLTAPAGAFPASADPLFYYQGLLNMVIQNPSNGGGAFSGNPDVSGLSFMIDIVYTCQFKNFTVNAGISADVVPRNLRIDFHPPVEEMKFPDPSAKVTSVEPPPVLFSDESKVPETPESPVLVSLTGSDP